MRFRYPGSFLKLLLLGFGLVAVPLVLALVDAFFSLERLAQRSEYAVTHAVQITRDSRALGEQLTALERLARQQLVLSDPAGLEAYAGRRTLFLDTLTRLASDNPDASSQDELNNLVKREAEVWQLLEHPDTQSPPTEEQTRAVVDIFSGMANTASDMVHHADARIEDNVANLQAQAEAAREQMLLRLLALIPIGLLLIAGMVFLIRRPIRQLGAGIRKLGDGRFDQQIVVSGPHDLEALGKQLDWLRLRLAEVDAQKTRFLHHVSHELKTPLTALYEGTHLLSDNVAGALNGQQQEIAGILLQNAARLRQLIENLLDYSSIRFQPMSLKRSVFALAGLFAQVAEDHRLALAARQLRLHMEDGGLTIDADLDKLRVVLDNLISNAVKYAPEGSIIEVLASRDGNTIAIEVADCGPGIPLETSEQMFQPFVQGAPPRGASIKGSGLGLSIVKELVAAHSGEVVLQNNHPVGTRVLVRLPQQHQAIP